MTPYEFSWIRIAKEMKSSGKDGRFSMVRMSTSLDENVSTELSYIQVLENALEEALGFIPSVPELEQFHLEIFDRVPSSAKISGWIYMTGKMLSDKKIKNV